MKMLRILYHIARADFFERTRRYSFLVTTGVLVYLAYLSFPPIDAKYLVVGLGDFRGIYNSAWVGSSIALLCNTMLALIGFYLINNSIKRDDTTGVGQIIATTPLSKWAYLIGKMISNLFFLMSMVGIITIVSVGMQFYRAESTTIELWDLLAPLFLTTLPMMALVSAVALLFESIKFLRGGIGNVLYYALVMAAMMSSLGFENDTVGRNADSTPFGVSLIVSSMQEAAYISCPDYNGGFAIGGSDVKDHVETFEWKGVDWTANIILWRLFWLGIALLITSLVTIFFKRFDHSYQFIKKKKIKEKLIAKPAAVAIEPNSVVNIKLTPLAEFQTGPITRLLLIVTAELKIMLKGLHKIWYLAALVFIILSMTLPIDAARLYILPIAWVWPLLVWSKMGNREINFRTDQYMFAAPHPVMGQLPAVWLAGFVVALVTGIGWPVRMVLAGEVGFILPWLVGAMFIPSLALSLGVWSGSSKMFEVVYFVLWYVGPMNQIPFLDFIGITGNVLTPQVTLTFFAVSLLLLTFSVIGRRRQVSV